LLQRYTIDLDLSTPSLNSRIELALVLERQILEVLSRAEADQNLALCVLRAASAQVESMYSGSRVLA
jgi:hypothetical protein